MKRRVFKVVSVMLTVILLVSVSVTSVAAGQGYGREQRNVPTPEIQHLDAEVRVIAGQPVIVVENEGGYVHIPFALSGDVLVQGNGVVVQTEDGSVVVPLEEFEVVVVGGGQLALVAEGNPIFTLIFFAVGAKLGAKYFPVLAGVKANTASKKAGALAGAAAGSAVGAAYDAILFQHWLTCRR
ncbi:MAG: hypothetical protein DDT32_01966 [Syntrophomonadaceae bacterium]|nr:hypothetical protein [Bacillota bacterium]